MNGTDNEDNDGRCARAKLMPVNGNPNILASMNTKE